MVQGPEEAAPEVRLPGRRQNSGPGVASGRWPGLSPATAGPRGAGRSRRLMLAEPTVCWAACR